MKSYFKWTHNPIQFEYNTSMTPWRLISTSPARGDWNMAVDEAILESIGRGASLPTLRLYAWTPACLSLGVAQPFADVDSARLRARGWDVVRRITGGRAILHTDELTYSVIGPAENPILAGSVLESYSRIAKALLRAVQDLNLNVEMQEDVGQVANLSKTNPVCFEVPSTYEITVDGKKLIGSAQARRKDGVLQHGSLPLTGDLTRITEALAFTDESAREDAAARLLARAATVETALSRAVAWDDAARAMVRAFEAELGIQFERGELSQNEISRTDELVREKYGNSSWTGRV
jgi:lipoate-protein ligase A